jgi:hypothetical protein
VGQRPLDSDEQSLFDAIRKGATDPIRSGTASLVIRWQEFEDVSGKWPIFVLTAASAAAPAVAWWLWPHERTRGDATVAALAVGDFEAGIVATLGSPDRDKLSASVTRCARAFMEGGVTYEARSAQPNEYEDTVPAQALTVWLRWNYQTPQGTGGEEVRGYLEDPDAFARETGIPISGQLDGEYRFIAFMTRA